jgi:hypothetical protein
VVNLERFASSGETVCELTGRRTKFPGKEFYDLPFASHRLADRSDEIIAGHFETSYPSVAGSGFKSLPPPPPPPPPPSEEKTKKRDRGAFLLSHANRDLRDDGSKKRRIGCEDGSQSFLNVRDAVLPFTAVSIRQRSTFADGSSLAPSQSSSSSSQAQAQRRKMGTSFGSRSLRKYAGYGGDGRRGAIRGPGANGKSGTKSNVGKSAAVVAAVKTEKKKIDDELDRFLDKNSREIRSLPQLNLREELKGVKGKKNKKDLEIALYFRKKSNVADLFPLFERAKKNSLLGRREAVVSESRRILDLLLYSDARRNVAQAESQVKRQRCLKELYQLCATLVVSNYKQEKDLRTSAGRRINGEGKKKNVIHGYVGNGGYGSIFGSDHGLDNIDGDDDNRRVFEFGDRGCGSSRSEAKEDCLERTASAASVKVVTLDVMQCLPLIAKYYRPESNSRDEFALRYQNERSVDDDDGDCDDDDDDDNDNDDNDDEANAYGKTGTVPKDQRFVEFFEELCWLQWNVVCASPFGMEAHRRSRSPSTSESGSRRSTKLSAATGGGGDHNLNRSNCCLSTLYDLTSGQIVCGKVVVPKLSYAKRYAPPITDIVKYGFKKKMLTKGVNQRTAAYKSLLSAEPHQGGGGGGGGGEGEFRSLCNFDFSRSLL